MGAGGSLRDPQGPCRDGAGQFGQRAPPGQLPWGAKRMAVLESSLSTGRGPWRLREPVLLGGRRAQGCCEGGDCGAGTPRPPAA